MKRGRGLFIAKT